VTVERLLGGMNVVWVVVGVVDVVTKAVVEEVVVGSRTLTCPIRNSSSRLSTIPYDPVRVNRNEKFCPGCKTPESNNGTGTL